MKNKLLIFLLLPLFAFSQQFADKSYYLIDSLVLEDLSKDDRNLIDSCLIEYHKTKLDTNKVKLINIIVEGCYDEVVWPKYNLWIYKHCKNKLQNSDDNVFYNKMYASSINNIGFYYNNLGETKKALNCFLQALKIEEKTDNKEGIASLLNNIGFFYHNEGNIEKALEFHNRAVKINTEINSKEGIATSLNNIGFIYRNKGKVEKALEYYHKSLKIYKEINDKQGIATALNNIGFIYQSQKNNEKALEYYQLALKTEEEIGNKLGISSSLNNIGMIYKDQNKIEIALEYYHRSLKIDIEIENKLGISALLNNIAVIYLRQERIDDALDYLQQSLNIKKELGNKEGTAITILNIGNIYKTKGNDEKAKQFLSESFKLFLELGFTERISESAKSLSELAAKQNNFEEAYKMYSLHIKMRDSTNNLNTQKAAIEQEAKYLYENQKAIDDIENQKHLELQEEKNKRQLIATTSAVSILLLVVVFLIFVYRRLQITKKQNLIIEQQKIEVETKQRAFEEANKEINDSINYAKLIQNAVLPSIKIKDLLNDSFLYFNPKEKVSGDFFWLEQKDNYSGYCVADCTGHGIPGAFISMIGTILLNEIYNSKQIEIPNKILDELSRLVRLTLTDKDGHIIKDGMDLSFVALNNKTKIIYFSGANNPVWIASNSPQKNINKKIVEPIFEQNGKYMYEIKGDKQPIGFYGENSKPFTMHRAELIEGDTFYLFSDGYVDQFGGGLNKKFKAKAFRELLLSINDEDMNIQQNILAEQFESWKGDLEQIDDVTVMGVRV